MPLVCQTCAKDVVVVACLDSFCTAPVSEAYKAGAFVDSSCTVLLLWCAVLVCQMCAKVVACLDSFCNATVSEAYKSGAFVDCNQECSADPTDILALANNTCAEISTANVYSLAGDTICIPGQIRSGARSPPGREGAPEGVRVLPSCQLATWVRFVLALLLYQECQLSWSNRLPLLLVFMPADTCFP